MTAIGEDQTNSIQVLQIPEIRSRLFQPKRSLADKISSDKGKKQSSQTQMFWMQSQSKYNIVLYIKGKWLVSCFLKVVVSKS